MFDPKNLFPIIALVFVAVAAMRYMRNGLRWDGSIRTWLMMAAIFCAVAIWLRVMR